MYAFPYEWKHYKKQIVFKKIMKKILNNQYLIQALNNMCYVHALFCHAVMAESTIAGQPLTHRM
jgi:hypothetical protein